MLESPISKQVVFARNSFTELCSFHGMEIAIGKLNASDLKEIAKIIEEDNYLDSDYFNNWYDWNDTFHGNGVFLDGLEVNELADENELSTPNTEIGNISVKDICLNNKHIYLCTFRNENIYFLARAESEEINLKRIDCEVTQFGFLKDLLDIDVAILKSAFLDGKEMNRDSAEEEGSGEIYDTHQFLIFQNKIIYYATNGEGQTPFFMDDSISQIKFELSNKDEILSDFKLLFPENRQ